MSLDRTVGPIITELPVRGAAFTCQIALEDYANPGNFKSSPTLASGDFKVSKDGDALSNLATLPTNSPAASVLVTIALSGTEMDADVVSVVCIDQTNPKEWADRVISIVTAS